MGIGVVKYIYGLLGTAVLVGCTGSLRQINLNVSEPPSFSVDENLDLTGLDASVSTSGDGTPGSPFALNFKEYLARRELRFKNLGVGSQVECTGTQSNLAVRATALNQSTPTIELSPNYFFTSESDRAENEIQDFSCWLNNGSESSEKIHFKILLAETPTVKVSQANLTTGPYYSQSSSAVISGNGQYVLFSSNMHDLVIGDSNLVRDVFVKNLSTGDIERASVDSGGGDGDGASSIGAISPDGRYVVFQSSATNLVVGDTNGWSDIFVHDRQTRATTRVSVDSSGGESNAISNSPTISSDGRFVVFLSSATNLVASDTNARQDAFVHDRQTGNTTRVSVDSSGTQGNEHANSAIVSSDGGYVTFHSSATNLVAGDTNVKTDIFVHDRQTGATTRVSVDSSGTQGNQDSFSPSISSDGRLIAFISYASDLVAGDTNANPDIFVHDRQTGATTMVSVDSSGTQGNLSSLALGISSDGRYVSFTSLATNLVAGDANGLQDVFVHDRQTGATSRVSVDSSGTEGNNTSSAPSLNSDGRYIAFISLASNLVAGDTNTAGDIFVHDRQTSVTARQSVDSAGTQGNQASSLATIRSNGRYVAFSSVASNIVSGDTNGISDIFVHDRQSGGVSRVSVHSNGTQANNVSTYPALSSDGRYVAFSSSASNLVASDTNATSDIFVHDRQTGATSRVSVDSSGTEGNGFSQVPAISSDGRFVAFESSASNLVGGDANGAFDIFVHDRQTGVTSRVSVDSSGTEGNNTCTQSVISSDGRYVAFSSFSSNLVAGDLNATADIFIHDRQTGATSRASVDSSGVEGNGFSASSSLSPDGRFVAFSSAATNFVGGDTNGVTDIFVHDRQTGATSRVSVDSSGTQGNSLLATPSISSDGRYVAFQSDATNLVAGDTNVVTDIFVHDRQSGTTARISVDDSGGQGNGISRYATISSDGRYVAFQSVATALVPATQTALKIFLCARHIDTEPNFFIRRTAELVKNYGARQTKAF